MALTLSSKVFEYESLSDVDSFRLLLLQPSRSHDSDLRCNILHTTLSQCDRDIIDQYTALSYVWGNPSNIGSIYLNDTLLTITANLDAALRDLRDESRVLRIWADGLCIDQSSLTERASQVNLMDRIYLIADHTIIHLGSLTSEAETILKAAPSNTSGIVIDCYEIVAIAEQNMLKAVWFTRVWVFQELVLSRDPWIQYGNLRARWTHICDLLISDSSRQGSKELQVLADMDSSRGPTRQQFLKLLTSRRGLGATDARDMIYANMGIALDHSSLLECVQVDYTRSCEDVFESVAQYLLENSEPEGPTAFFPHAASNERSNRKSLASWAPDWSLPSPNLVKMYRDNLTEKLQLAWRLHCAFVGHPPTLAWVGYEVDIVKSYSVEFPHAEAYNITEREYYQECVSALMSMYSNVWWSGDESGQHQHVDFRGNEEMHASLCRNLADEWLRIVKELPATQAQLSSDDFENQKKFIKGFKVWLESRARQQIIMAGSASEGMACIMYYYLQPQNIPSALTGRRLAITRSGRVAVVPRNVLVGDLIVQLAGTLNLLVVRKDQRRPRKQHMDRDIRNALKAKNDEGSIKEGYRLEGMEHVDKLGVKRCTLVGECYIDGEVGWKLNQAWDLGIFALR